MLIQIGLCFQKQLEKCQCLDFIAPLALRLYLVPIFWMAGLEKFMHFSSTVAWFGNSDWGLGLPFPTVMAALATITELVGAVCLTLGLATRWICLPLMTTMIVAVAFVHWDNGWLAIAHDQQAASLRLDSVLDWLSSHFPQKHRYLTELGEPVIE